MPAVQSMSSLQAGNVYLLTETLILHQAFLTTSAEIGEAFSG